MSGAFDFQARHRVPFPPFPSLDVQPILRCSIQSLTVAAIHSFELCVLVALLTGYSASCHSLPLRPNRRPFDTLEKHRASDITMYAPTFVIAAVLAIAQLAIATPPACLIAALG
jgi:hypothetical protein